MCVLGVFVYYTRIQVGHIKYCIYEKKNVASTHPKAINYMVATKYLIKINADTGFLY